MTITGPSWIRSPSCTTIAPVTGFSLTIVPVLLPRSSSLASWPVTRIRACLREMPAASICTIAADDVLAVFEFYAARARDDPAADRGQRRDRSLDLAGDRVAHAVSGADDRR